MREFLPLAAGWLAVAHAFGPDAGLPPAPGSGNTCSWGTCCIVMEQDRKDMEHKAWEAKWEGRFEGSCGDYLQCVDGLDDATIAATRLHCSELVEHAVTFTDRLADAPPEKHGSPCWYEYMDFYFELAEHCEKMADRCSSVAAPPHAHPI